MKAAKEEMVIEISMRLRLAVTLVGALLCLGGGVADVGATSIPTSSESVAKGLRFGVDASWLDSVSLAEVAVTSRDPRATEAPQQAVAVQQAVVLEPRFTLLEDGAWPDRDHFHLFAGLHVAAAKGATHV